MNNSMIVFILGQIIRLEGLLMIIPCLTSLIYQEHEIFAFLIVIISCLVIGTLMTLRKPANQTIYLKEGCVATAFSWILLSIFGCMPFVIQVRSLHSQMHCLRPYRDSPQREPAY